MGPVLVVPIGIVLVALLGCGSTAATKERQDRMYQASRANVELGIGYMREGNLDLANTKLTRALEEDPEYSVAHWAYALLQWRLADTELADKHFRKAIALDPKDAKARNNYGSFLCETGRIPEAVQEFEAAAKNPLYKDGAGALTNAGLCMLRVPEMDKAVAYFRSALAKDPGYGPALYQLAKMTFQKGDYIQARTFMQLYSQSAKWTASTLWLSYEIERHLGHREDAARWAAQLSAEYPDSREARRLKELERYGR